MSDAEPRHVRHEFEPLVLPYLEALARLARFLVPKNRADAEDLVQEAVLRAYTAFPRFQPGTNLRAWLFRILRNTWVDLLRRQGRAADALTELGWELLPASEALRAEAARAASEADVEAALGRLPGDLRVTLLLVDGEGMRYEEAAAVLECPVGTVRSRLHRGRRLLRQHLLEMWRGRPGDQTPGR